MYGNSSNKTYPRTTDPVSGEPVEIIGTTETTITVNVGPSVIKNYDVHNAVFVDHLNTSPNYGQSYTNWYNSKTGNSGIIKVTRSYVQGPFKCKDYDATVDITSSWPLVGIGGQKRAFIHISDTAECIKLAIENDKFDKTKVRIFNQVSTF